jgi:hypothetical protein
MDDLALSPAEQAYFDSAGTDISGVLSEAGRSSAPASDGTPELTDAERHFFSSGGDITHDLLREHGQAPAPQTEPQFRPEVQAFIDRAVAAHKSGHHDERLAHARTAERLSLLQQAVAPPPTPDPEPPARPDPETDIFGYVRNIGDRLTSYEQQIQTGQAEMEEEGRYRASLDAAARQEPAVLQAYGHLLTSRAAELMASRYPSATPDQLRQAVVQGQVPADIKAMIQSEERAIYKDSFAAGRNPAVDVIRMAQLRGWRSPQQIESTRAAHAAEQHRQQEAKAAAERREEEAEAEWRRGIAIKLQYGMSMDELPRADRVRFYRGARAFRG